MNEEFGKLSELNDKFDKLSKLNNKFDKLSEFNIACFCSYAAEIDLENTDIDYNKKGYAFIGWVSKI